MSAAHHIQSVGKLSTVVAKKPAYYNNRPEGDFGLRSPFAAAYVKLCLVDPIGVDRRFYDRKTPLRAYSWMNGPGGTVCGKLYARTALLPQKRQPYLRPASGAA